MVTMTILSLMGSTQQHISLQPAGLPSAEGFVIETAGTKEGESEAFEMKKRM